MDMPKSDVILVTGSSGLIGYPVAQRLATQFDVVDFDQAGPPHPPPALKADPLGWYRANHLDPPPWLSAGAAPRRRSA